MEEEWRVYLKEHRPDLYEQMLKSMQHSVTWQNELLLEVARLLEDASVVVWEHDEDSPMADKLSDMAERLVGVTRGL